MTVTYTDQVATAKGLTLIKLFFRWKGSVIRLLWKDLLVYLAAYFMLHFIYAYVFNETLQLYFENIVTYAKKYDDIKTLSFVLGFFVSIVMTRWWNQFLCIPWPHSISVYVSSTIHGYDEVGRALRRTILRYVNLSLVMVFRVLSPRVKKRFPRMDDLISAGLINENELIILQELEKKFPGYSKNWLPICWAANVATRARADGRIKDDFALKTIIEELNKFRGRCGELMNYAMICIPLVYTQVVTVAVYTFFLTALISQQPIKIRNESTENRSVEENNHLYFLDSLPFMLTLQFIFYMGWLKVAETMINPFGEDDDDFEVNWMIDRNLIMSYLIVDEMHNDHPELLKDQFWNEIPKQLPDLGRTSSKELVPGHHQKDFFDVDQNPSTVLRQRRTLIIPTDMEEEVQPQLTLTVNPSKTELKPRSSVIDETYRRLTDVEMTQSLLDKSMQKIRDKAATPKDGSDSETDSSIIDSTKFS
ncbi:bestrophin-2a-like [Chironomus tepperi]|uniref:bestrophin-2a-like n=1 Tax=Chironomus tepperi TaxID=113505 RepID=UPI00391F380E